MKKRFFTFLMAVWALLSISQTVKADDDVYLLSAEQINGVTGDYTDNYTAHPMKLESGDTYKIKIESNSSAADFYFRVRVGGGSSYQLYPSQNGDLLDITEEGSTNKAKTANNSGSGAWKVSFDKNTYEYITIHVVIRDQTKVWVDGKKKGSGTVTPIEKYCSFYLIGNLYKENH